MTEINIITSDIQSAELVVSVLENESLLLHSFIQKEATRNLPVKWKISGQTRAILFDKILEKISVLIPENLVTIYSKPIVNMQWEKADLLLKTIKSA